MQFQLDRSSTQPLYLQLVQNIQERIRSGGLPAGARLPTVRELALQLHVTRLTIHSAYSELQAGGWVEATVGRGTFVAARAEAETQLELGREVSTYALINDMIRAAQIPGMRSLAGANAAAEFIPTREFGKALDEALTSGASVFEYTSTQGEPLLRTTLAELLRERGLRAGPDELLITSGVTQGFTLIARTLAQPGDAVIVEQPTYLGALNVLHHAGLRVFSAPRDQHGLIVDALEPLIVAQRPRFMYVMPTFHNPTGTSLSAARRTALLALAEKHHVPIIEDDIYAQLTYTGSVPPSLKMDDPNGMVLHLSSFSKALMPGIRIGYIAAAPAFIRQLVFAKQADDLCSPTLLQRALALFIQHGWLENHLRRSLPRYRERRDALLDAMAQHFPREVRWTTPQGGFCSWVTLPPSTSPTELYLQAIERGVAIAPGDMFFVGAAPRPHIRLSFSTLPPPQIAEAVQILGNILHTQQHRRSFAIPTSAELVPFV